MKTGRSRESRAIGAGPLVAIERAAAGAAPAHPQVDRFDRDRFCEGLRHAGFRLVGTRTLWSAFGWFVGDRERG